MRITISTHLVSLLLVGCSSSGNGGQGSTDTTTSLASSDTNGSNGVTSNSTSAASNGGASTTTGTMTSGGAQGGASTATDAGGATNAVTTTGVDGQGGATSTSSGADVSTTTSTDGGAGTGGQPFVQPALVTSSADAYWVTSGTLTEVASGAATVTVNDTATAQTWDGFGGSFNELGWSYLLLLSEADRDTALRLLFAKDGCNFALGRIPMGSSDYGMDRYTLDEVPSGETDLTMASFSVARDEQLLIPFIQAAQAIKGDIYFWASPWSPPTWMKEGPFNDDSPFDGGSMKTDAATLAAHAQYFVKFVQAYADHDIDIKTVAPQNEPGYSGTYPTCAWDPSAYASFVGEHLGPALSGAGLSTKIMLGTFNAGDGDTDIISTVMADSTANPLISVLGYQWGMEGSVASHTEQYGRPIWQSEHKCGNYPWETATFNDMIAPNDLAYAVESWGLLKGWIGAGVTGYSVWNMVLDTIGNGIDSMRFWPQNALLTVDTDAGTLGITPTYYVVRHLSQFVVPGATVVATSGGDALAFKNPDGSIATVMYNSGAATSYTLSVAGKLLQFEMPAGGWATVYQ